MLTWKDVVKFATHGNPNPNRRVEYSDVEWRDRLSPEQFRITRHKGTEARFSGEHCSIYEPGVYSCVCCDEILFDGDEKFDSRSGWPSFTQPAMANSIQYKKDDSLRMTRIEALCNTCDAHLGHVFPDGPAPSGLRYCINSISLTKKMEEIHE